MERLSQLAAHLGRHLRGLLLHLADREKPDQNGVRVARKWVRHRGVLCARRYQTKGLLHKKATTARLKSSVYFPEFLVNRTIDEPGLQTWLNRRSSGAASGFRAAHRALSATPSSSSSPSSIRKRSTASASRESCCVPARF